MSEELSPAPWTTERRGYKVNEETHCVVLDSAGRVVCDTINSEVVVIIAEVDEDSVTYTDEQGRADMEFIALARNAFDGNVLALAWWEQNRKRIRA